MTARNGLHCNTCNTTIISTHRHDFKFCNCTDTDTSIFVDGGNDYRRAGCGPKANFRPLEDGDE